MKYKYNGKMTVRSVKVNSFRVSMMKLQISLLITIRNNNVGVEAFSNNIHRITFNDQGVNHGNYYGHIFAKIISKAIRHSQFIRV